jgi:ferritin
MFKHLKRMLKHVLKTEETVRGHLLEAVNHITEDVSEALQELVE